MLQKINKEHDKNPKLIQETLINIS